MITWLAYCCHARKVDDEDERAPIGILIAGILCFAFGGAGIGVALGLNWSTI
jgi:hypothetical protein